MTASDYKLSLTSMWGLLKAPNPDRNVCIRCGWLHSKGSCIVDKAVESKQMQAATPTRLCNYPRCRDPTQPDTKLCTRLNLRCSRCGFRGHSKHDDACGNLQINLDEFECYTGVGWIKAQRFEYLGATAGYFPVLTSTLAKELDALGGYRMMMVHDLKRIVELIRRRVSEEEQLIGLEPFLTEKLLIKAMTHHAVIIEGRISMYHKPVEHSTAVKRFMLKEEMKEKPDIKVSDALNAIKIKPLSREAPVYPTPSTSRGRG
jgi:hypothetical protein